MRVKDILQSALKLMVMIGLIFALSACGSSSDGDEDANSMIACGSSAEDTSCHEDNIDKNCVACVAFNFVYDAVNKCLKDTQAEYLNGAPAVMMVAFAIWLALRLLKYVSSVTENTVAEVWNEILRKGYICLICFFVVSSQTSLNGFVNIFIMPVYSTFLELGVKIMDTSLSSGEMTTTTVPTSTQGAMELANWHAPMTLPEDTMTMYHEKPLSFRLFGEQVTVAKPRYSCNISENDLKVAEGGGFPPKLKGTINCIFNYLRDYLSSGAEFGKKAMQDSGAIGWLVGLFVYLCFMIVKVCFAFYLVDSIFQMGVILILLPVFIMSLAFGPTKKWMTNAIGYILSSSAFLMCFSVLCAMTVRAMVELISANPEIFDPQGEAQFSELSIGFMCLLLMGFLIYGSMGVASQLTSGLLGAKNSSNFQKKLKAVAQAGAQAVKNGVSALFTWGASAFPNSMLARAKRMIDNAKGAVQKAAGRGK